MVTICRLLLFACSVSVLTMLKLKFEASDACSLPNPMIEIKWRERKIYRYSKKENDIQRKEWASE